ncbi:MULTISPECIES: hypothetical protein [unclassified Bradyrhizobium]|uniref:hypothetical protein n=1 Tax=unclassified Bradyrhizobium TaxID=2631580 RepID=UPI0020B1D4BA|nr:MULTISPECIES: hypothetical protein [unclassified Bradyrhizobium]MCP3398901.1 hypothetical protein [Bradyrhizobium sp. CCGB20]MCP3407503.1 hypothetical protein [Bradyrhizobium sp. CCGB01]
MPAAHEASHCTGDMAGTGIGTQTQVGQNQQSGMGAPVANRPVPMLGVGAADAADCCLLRSDR